MKLLIALMLFSIPTWALNLNFTWTDPVAREDGSMLPAGEISHCTLYKDAVELAQILGGVGVYTENVSAGAKTLYTITCSDTAGIESEQSDPVEVNLHRPAKVILNVDKVSN